MIQLQFTAEQMATLNEATVLLPHYKAVPFIASINAQINAQQQPAQPAPVLAPAGAA